MTQAARPDVRLERKGDALWVWIDREERRNAINSAVLAGIADAIARTQADPTLRAVVLTGSGDKAFCAGADLSEGIKNLADSNQPANRDHPAPGGQPTTEFGRLARTVRQAGVPLIARVNGACVAGGMGLMALCDLAIAAEHARFGLPEVRVGVFPMQVLVLLRRTLHARHINELCLTGELIGAARAAQMGLINEVAAPGELDLRVDALLERLRSGAPGAIRRGKHVIFAMESMPFEEAIAFAEAEIAATARSAEAQEGLRAFGEKRKPGWADQD